MPELAEAGSPRSSGPVRSELLLIFPWHLWWPLTVALLLVWPLVSSAEAGSRLGPGEAMGVTADAALDRGTVILLSWDGTRHDALELATLPHLSALARLGMQGRLRSVMPANTFPAHVSLATGVLPHQHGIVDNHFFDRERGWYHMDADTRWLEAEPLWITAERQRVTSAVYFWVGSERDWRGQRATYREAPFDARRPEAAKVDQILKWLMLPDAERPRLIMAYWRGADLAGHRFGPDGGRVRDALEAQDVELGRLMDGIEAGPGWGEVTLMVVSDHGMTPAGEFVPAAAALAEAGIPATLSGSTLCHLFLKDPAMVERAAAVLRALEPRLEVYRPGAEPDHWGISHPQRTGDLIIAAPPPLVLRMAGGFTGWVNRTGWKLGWTFGGHGYDPTLPAMHGIWVAGGRGIEPQPSVETYSMLSVAPTVAELLDIEPAAAATAPSLGSGRAALAR